MIHQEKKARAEAFKLEVKNRIDAYVDETYRCWIDQEASMKKNGLCSMFEQILEDGKQLATMEGNNESK